MERTCSNCLNAYNNPYTPHVLCVNKEFDAQFRNIDVTVRHDETCGTWSERQSDQKPLRFQRPTQLYFDFG